METFTIKQIIELQKDYGFTEVQKNIESGLAWKLEGSQGRYAMDCLKSGACYLPEERKIDTYKNIVPSRNDLKDGTKGTLGNSIRFWNDVVDGRIELEEISEVEEE